MWHQQASFSVSVSTLYDKHGECLLLKYLSVYNIKYYFSETTEQCRIFITKYEVKSLILGGAHVSHSEISRSENLT